MWRPAQVADMVPIREPQTYSVLLADDLTLVREGLAALCSAQPTYRVVGQCSEGVVALRMIESSRPDIAVLDLNLPDLFTLEDRPPHSRRRHPDQGCSAIGPPGSEDRGGGLALRGQRVSAQIRPSQSVAGGF